MKTWHWLHTAPERLAAKPWIVQADYVVAAPSRAAAARSIGFSDQRQLFNLCETFNAGDVERAAAKPGTAFWRHIDEHRGEWRELRADQVRAIGGRP